MFFQGWLFIFTLFHRQRLHQHDESKDFCRKIWLELQTCLNLVWFFSSSCYFCNSLFFQCLFSPFSPNLVGFLRAWWFIVWKENASWSSTILNHFTQWSIQVCWYWHQFENRTFVIYVITLLMNSKMLFIYVVLMNDVMILALDMWPKLRHEKWRESK